MGRVFILNYNMNEITYEDMVEVSSVMECRLPEEDKVIVMPHTFQMHEMSKDELITLQQHIDVILRSM